MLRALGALAAGSPPRARLKVQGLMSDLLTRLLERSAPDARARLARTLVAEPWTPGAVLLQLATGPLDPEVLAQLVERAGEAPAIRAALARHPALTTVQAQALLRSVGPQTAAALRARFGELRPEIPRSAPEDPSALVEKLRAAGRLSSGALLRFLRQGRLKVFQAGVAALTGEPLAEVRAACRARDPGALTALLARAGFDRSVVPEALAGVARTRQGRDAAALFEAPAQRATP